MLKNKLFVSVCAALVSGFAGFSTFGLYVAVDLERIPVERLAKNLQERIEKEPDDPTLRHNLARLHAMAYALKVVEAEVAVGHPEYGAWFGYEPKHVPFTVKSAADENEQKIAEGHLVLAIAEYERLLNVDPENLTGRLGYAWCLEQAGRKNEAIGQYRKTIEDGWEAEKSLNYFGPGDHSIVVEAGGYLVPLLDPIKDKQEISSIKKRSARIGNRPRAITPIAVPLGDRLTVTQLEDSNAKVIFDADGTGNATPWTWIKPNAAWLVSDPHGSGEITSALQMFGNVTWWLFWENGYQALSVLDDDVSGDLSGAELDGLALWCDTNRNGLSDEGEVLPLSAYGIVSLSCEWDVLSNHPDRIAYSPRGVTFSNGITRATYDLILRSVR